MLFQTLAELNADFQPMYDNVLSNRQRWHDLSTGDDDAASGHVVDL